MNFPPIAELLPHAGRAILIDAIVANSERDITAILTVSAAHPYFVIGCGVPAWVGLEMMAQAVAAHGGLAAQRSGRGPRRGMLLGSREYQAHVPWFVEGMCLQIRAHQAFGHAGGGPAACDGRIECGGRLLARATLTILEETDP